MAPTYEIKKLWQLQQLDLMIIKLRQQLGQPQTKPAFDKIHSEAGQALRKVKRDELTAEELQKRIRRAELELATLEAQIKDAETALYSGTTTSAKELAGIERKLATAREQRSKQEEDVLETMQEMETLQQDLSGQKREARELTSQYKVAKTKLEDETTNLQNKLQQVTVERQDLAATIDTAWLTRYDKWRQQRQDAIALIEGSYCGVCHVLLPNGLISEVQTSGKPTYCESCGRILCPS
jgi:predicted  nucleic acid-binding Zn-ribbon protein